MTHGSLFSGIGGFDLAAEWMGWENKFHCEWNPFGQKVLHHYWPQAEQFTDITKTDFTKYANRIDILTGGFPCQPYSSAGKRLGKEDERHLWPEMLRAIREIQPRWVVGENVLGLVNWNGGLVFNEVQTDLEAEGYEVQPYVLPAVSLNAPHRRDRVWFVAYSNRNGRRCICGQQSKQSPQAYTKHCDTCRTGFTTNTEYKGLEGQYREWEGCTEHRTDKGIFIGSENKLNATNPESNGLNQCNSNNEVNTSEGRVNALSNINESNGDGITSDTLSIRLQQCENGTEMGGGQGEMGRERSQPTNAIKTNGEVSNLADTNKIRFSTKMENGKLGREQRFTISDKRNAWDSFPSVSPICNGNDGISDRLDNITFPKWRNESIKAGGNAVVPQVVYQIFKTIEQYEKLNAWTSQ
jgi:DNA (cytosine-5)-methyltransferase 1